MQLVFCSRRGTKSNAAVSRYSFSSLHTSVSDTGEHLVENCAVFAAAITRTAQDIDTLIESLPNQEYTPEMQNESLRRLEEENRRSAERLAKIVEEGEVLLQEIQDSLRQICDSQLRKPNM